MRTNPIEKKEGGKKKNTTLSLDVCDEFCFLWVHAQLSGSL
jgi:hypothetical protein